MGHQPHTTVVPRSNDGETVYKLMDMSDSWNAREVGIFKSRSDAILAGIKRKSETGHEFSVRERYLS